MFTECSLNVNNGRCTAEVHSGGRVAYPPVVNDDAAYALGMATARRLLGGTAVRIAKAPVMVCQHRGGLEGV
jgi:hypothetical protein